MFITVLSRNMNCAVAESPVLMRSLANTELPTAMRASRALHLILHRRGNANLRIGVRDCCRKREAE